MSGEAASLVFNAVVFLIRLVTGLVPTISGSAMSPEASFTLGPDEQVTMERPLSLLTSPDGTIVPTFHVYCIFEATGVIVDLSQDKDLSDLLALLCAGREISEERRLASLELTQAYLAQASALDSLLDAMVFLGHRPIVADVSSQAESLAAEFGIFTQRRLNLIAHQAAYRSTLKAISSTPFS